MTDEHAVESKEPVVSKSSWKHDLEKGEPRCNLPEIDAFKVSHCSTVALNTGVSRHTSVSQIPESVVRLISLIYTIYHEQSQRAGLRAKT